MQHRDSQYNSHICGEHLVRLVYIITTQSVRRPRKKLTTHHSTDLCVLAIPIPLLWKVKIPLRRKLVIGILLCSGIFVISAALLRCILTLQKDSNILNADIWGVRETFVSIIAVSAPAIRPLFNKETWVTGSILNPNSLEKLSKAGYAPRSGNDTTSHELRDVEWGAEHKSFDTRNAQRLPDSSSEEYMVPRLSAESEQSKKSPLKIEVTTMYELNNCRESQVGDRGVVLPRPEGAARSEGTGWRHVQSETRIVGGGKSDSRGSKQYHN